MAATKKRGTTTTRTTTSKETKTVARKGAPRTNTKAKANGSPETKKTSPAKKAKTATVKLTEKQTAFLRQIQAAGPPGYEPKNKSEQRTLDALLTRKVIKRGTKNKESGNYRYLITKAGEKHIGATA